MLLGVLNWNVKVYVYGFKVFKFLIWLLILKVKLKFWFFLIEGRILFLGYILFVYEFYYFFCGVLLGIKFCVM